MLTGSILQQLRDNHRSGHSDRPLNFGVYYKNTLVALCHALEDAILSADYQPLMITAFQRGKWYLQEADRYGDIAKKSQHIAILAAPESGFTDHPTSQQSNVTLVHLDPADPVAQEWHLIILSPHYTAMVLCQELSAADYGKAGPPAVDLERKFYGFWTFEPQLVLETAALAIAHIGQYDTATQQQLTEQIQAIATAMQSEEARCGVPTADHLGGIVERVVEYLQATHQPIAPSSSFLDDNLMSNELQAYLRMAQLMDQADLSNPNAAAEVATLAEAIGQLVDLPAWQLHRLRLAGLLHRLAFLRVVNSLLSPGTSSRYGEEEMAVPLSCPLVPGIQMLRRMPRLRAIATILTHQTEWWNGTGQPTGLAGDEIPIESRILALAIEFQQQLAHRRSLTGAHPPDSLLAQTYADCRSTQGDRWDPKLVDALGILVSALQQGLDLPVALPKIAAGLWLLTPSDALSLAYEPADTALRQAPH